MSEKSSEAASRAPGRIASGLHSRSGHYEYCILMKDLFFPLINRKLIRGNLGILFAAVFVNVFFILVIVSFAHLRLFFFIAFLFVC